MSKANRVILAVESDLHGGHRLGLLNPDTVLENERGKKYNPPLTETQEYLWELREWGRKEIIKLADKSPIVVFETGDVNQGLIYEARDGLAAQIEIAFMDVMPWLKTKNVVAVRIDSGTAAHSFGYGDAESVLASRITDRFPNIDAKTVYHGLSTIAGVKVDHAHHGPTAGSREWLKGNNALYYLKDIMMKDIMRGKSPPQLVLRGHYHTLVQVFNRINGADGKVYRSWMYVLPALCGANGFALQATKSEYEFTNGIIAFELVEGRIRESFEFVKTLDSRDAEVIL